MAVGGARVCDDDAMSDDDLWRPKDSGERSEDDPPPSEEPPAGVSDETQPITGTPAPPAGPSGPPVEPPSYPPPAYQPPAGPGGVPPPQNPYGQPYGQPPAGAQPYSGQPYQGQPYGAPPNPYQQPNEYAAPQSPYGSPYQPAYAGGMLGDHPSATTALVLGIISLVGILVCAGITLVLSPFAWVVGAKAVREIDASPGRYAGRDRAQAGKIMGIIGTVLLALGVVLIVGLIALASVSTSDSTPVTPQPSFQNG